MKGVRLSSSGGESCGERQRSVVQEAVWFRRQPVY